MKETVKTSRTAGYFEKIFRALNVKYFNGELEGAYHHDTEHTQSLRTVTVAKAWQRGDTTRHELNIGAGTLAQPSKRGGDHPPRVCTLVEPWKNGIQDCSRGGTYHNKKFKEAAEARDLKSVRPARWMTSPSRPTRCVS